MSGDPDKEADKPLGAFMRLVLAVVAVGMFVAVADFVVLWFEQGLSFASQHNKVGGVFFYLLVGFLYLAVIPVLHGNGYRRLSAAMTIVTVLLVVTIVLGINPSCEGDSSNLFDRPYRK